MDFTDKAGSINELLLRSGNGQCADCQKRLDLENAWGVLRYGVLVCQDCKLVHISLESQRKQKGLVEDPGILSCAKSQVWTSDDFNRFIQHGNEKTNASLLMAFPVWVYQPTPNDSISLKEQWISQKYRERSQEENQILNMPPKNAGTLCPVQFIRKSKSRTEPCAAVLHKEKLYLTSQRAERRKEVISIVDVETALLTQDNGIMLAYRAVDSPVTDEYLFAHLSHEDQTVVLEWVNTLLYIKYTLLKTQNPTVADKDLGKLLNRYVIRQSYVTAGSIPDQLLFFVLTESRLAVFEHHLDEKPRYQTRIYQNHMTSVQYLTRVGDVLNIQVEKVYGYDEWLQALDQALNNERLSALPERLQAPAELNHDLTTAMDNIRLCNVDAPRAPITQEPHQNQLPTEQPQPQPTQLVNLDQNGKTKVRTHQHHDIDDQSTKDAHCYPAIGPMGEMGKVYRGELSPEAIRPPPSAAAAAAAAAAASANQSNQAPPPPSSQQQPSQHQQQQQPPPPPTMQTAIPTPMSQSNGFYQPPQSNPYQPVEQQQLQQAPPPKKSVVENCYPPIGPLGLQEQQQPPPPLQAKNDAVFVVPEFRPRNEPSGQSRSSFRAASPGSWGSSSYSQFSQSSVSAAQSAPSNKFYAPSPPSPKAWNVKPTMAPPPPPQQQQQQQQPLQNGRSKQFDRSASEPSWNQARRESYSPTMEPWNSQRSSDNSYGQYNASHSQYEPPLPEPWVKAEKHFDHLIEHGFVPASDMKSAQIDANKFEHAKFCAMELYNAVVDCKYEMALSFLRGFRDIFGQSVNDRIRRMYVGNGERDTLKNIVLMNWSEQSAKQKQQQEEHACFDRWDKQPMSTSSSSAAAAGAPSRRASESMFKEYQPRHNSSSGETTLNPWSSEHRPNSNTSVPPRTYDIWGEPSPSPSTVSSNPNPYRISPESTNSADSWERVPASQPPPPPPQLPASQPSSSRYQDEFLVPPHHQQQQRHQQQQHHQSQQKQQQQQHQPPVSANSLLKSLDSNLFNPSSNGGIWAPSSANMMSSPSSLLGEDGWPSAAPVSQAHSSQRVSANDDLIGRASFRPVAPSTSIWSTN